MGSDFEKIFQPKTPEEIFRGNLDDYSAERGIPYITNRDLDFQEKVNTLFPKRTWNLSVYKRDNKQMFWFARDFISPYMFRNAEYGIFTLDGINILWYYDKLGYVSVYVNAQDKEKLISLITN